MAPKDDSWVRRFTVTDPFKHKKGFTLYKVTSVVFPKKFPESVTKVVIWKRYNDFKKLHKELKVRFQKLHAEEKFPPFVKAKFFGRFEADVIDERRQAALVLLEFVADHPPLFTSDVFVKFFETGYLVSSDDGSVSKTDLSKSDDVSSLLSSVDVFSVGQPVSNQSRLAPPVPPLAINSDDDHTSFTTDTDSAISSPLQDSDFNVFERLHERRDEYLHTSDFNTDTLLNRAKLQETTDELQPSVPSVSQSLTTLNSSVSTESLFSRKIQSLKNIFIGNNGSDVTDKIKDVPFYWVEAGQHIEHAVEREKLGDHEAAFALYKTAIACLLSGVQNDNDSERRKAVREKTSAYLVKAEFIADNFLSEKSHSKQTEKDLVPLSQLWQPISDLQWYKVLGVVGKTMLVIDTRTHCLQIIKYERGVKMVVKIHIPECIKWHDVHLKIIALHKSSCPVDKTRRCIFPRKVPYMVDLCYIFETDSSVFLVLEHVSGGKLWDYVSPYFRKQPLDPPPKIHPSGNPYVGQHLIDNEDQISVSTSDSCPSALQTVSREYGSQSTTSSPGNSYLDLIRDYTISKKLQAEKDSEQCLSETTEKLTSVEAETKLNTVPILHIDESVSDSDNVPITTVKSDVELPDETAVSELNVCNLFTSTLKKISDNESCDSNVPILSETSDKMYSELLNIITPDHVENNIYLSTGDLVENAQKLLKSVNEVLTESKTLVNRVNDLDINNDNIDSISSKLDSSNVLEVKKEDFDSLSVGSNASGRSLDITRLHADLSSKGSSPVSSVEIAPQWCHLEIESSGSISEHMVKRWAAQLLVALNCLHQNGIICMDLNPDNVLVNGEAIRLTYFCSFPTVEPSLDSDAVNHFYSAPEIMSIFPVTHAVDWWSYGVLLYQLLTGQETWRPVLASEKHKSACIMLHMNHEKPEITEINRRRSGNVWILFICETSLSSCHPGGILCHTVVYIPEYISVEACSLLKELLRYNPSERLGSGLLGVEEIKSHPFFEGIDWDQVYNDGLSTVF